MPKQRSYKTAQEKNRRIVVRINVREIEKKIRKPHAPLTKIHASIKIYHRKPKHPKRNDEMSS